MSKKILLILLILTITACGGNDDSTSTDTTSYVTELVEYPVVDLPEGLNWQTNLDDPVLGSPDAQRGGRYRTFVPQLPLTLRTVGPDSNSSFRSFINGNVLGLISFHPDTLNPIPMLANEWAFSDDNTTVYYRLNPNARWSDGQPVTADDFVFTQAFMRSEFIVAPWYNNYYSEQITAIQKHDDQTISITLGQAKPQSDLLFFTGISPTPRHFHKLDENWVNDYNWRVAPNTGAYQISKINKGKFIEFERVDNWWGDEHLHYFQHQFNVDKVRVELIRDMQTAFNHFLRAEIDAFDMTLPEYWHSKSKTKEFANGYIEKAMFYTDAPQSPLGIYLNTKTAPLDDRNVRLAFAHAMNFDRVISTVLRNDYVRLPGYTVGQGDYTNEAIQARDYSIDQATAYLNEAGWTERNGDGIFTKDGQPLVITLTFSQPHHKDRLVVLREEAKKAGIDLQLQQLDTSTAYKTIMEKSHQAAYMGWSTSFRPAYWEGFHSVNADKPQTNNITNFNDPAMDQLITDYRNSTEERERIRLAHEIQQLIHDSGVFVPRYQIPYTRGAHWRWVRLPEQFATKTSSALYFPFGVSGGLFWIDQSIKDETMAARKRNEKLPVVNRLDERYLKTDQPATATR